MLFNILATLAEFEADLICMRTREGMAIARTKGKLRGKQPKLSARHWRLFRQRSRRTLLGLKTNRLSHTQPEPFLLAYDAAPIGIDPKVFGLWESQIARRVKAITRAAGLVAWEFFSGHSGHVGIARRMAQNEASSHEIDRRGRWKQGGGMVGRYTRGESAGSALRYL